MALKFIPRVISLPVNTRLETKDGKPAEIKLIGEFFDEVMGAMNLATTRTAEEETVYIYVKNIEDLHLPIGHLDSLKGGCLQSFPSLLGYSHKSGHGSSQQTGLIVHLLFEPFDEALNDILHRRIDAQFPFEEPEIYQIINGSIQVLPNLSKGNADSQSPECSP